MKPTVTIVINTINERQDFLDLAIQSYLTQHSVDVELIISTVQGDSNIEHIKKNFPECIIVEMFRDDHPISKGIKSPVGSFLQLNNALKHMTGQWFCFASGNDVAYPKKCITEINMCIESKSEICYSAYNYMNQNGKVTSTQQFHQYNFEKHLKGNFVSDCAMISKKIVDKYLPFNVDLKNYAYWDLWLRVFKGHGNVFVYNETPTWKYRQDSSSMHLQRKKNPEQVRQANLDRKIMLKRHS